jgi:hypothetical protein
MSEPINRQILELPDIPNDPDPPSPLSPWKHYHILKELEGRFQAYLKEINYKGHLVGLEITYSVGENNYTMEYGYNYDPTENPMDGGKEDPLTDDLMDKMYDFASDLIAKHISISEIGFNVQISASVNQAVSTNGKTCKIATVANCGKAECLGKCRTFRKKNGNWVCQHTECNKCS